MGLSCTIWFSQLPRRHQGQRKEMALNGKSCGKVFSIGDFSSTDLHKMQTSMNKPANELLMNGLKDYAVIQANQTHTVSGKFRTTIRRPHSDEFPVI